MKKPLYKRILSFAYIPQSVLNNVRNIQSVSGDYLFAYLSFAFENAQERNIVETESYALFATDLENSQGDKLFCYFELNKNQKQKWVLTRIESAQGINDLQINAEFPEPVKAIDAFNLRLFEFAYVNKNLLSSVAIYFDNNVNKALSHISNVFELSNKYGYISYEGSLAVYNTGIQLGSEEIFALFKINRNEERQPWFFVGCKKKSEVKGITIFPECVMDEFVQGHGYDNERARKPTIHSNKKTLIVTAIQKEYDALVDVLSERKLKYQEFSSIEIGDRELRYIYIEQLNTYAILTGKSFECIIPLVQCLLLLKPDQAILAGIAFSFDMQKAPFNSLVISEQVWDYESTKITEADKPYWRGEKISSSPELRRLFNETVDRGHIKRSGVYASGMKIVNSVEFQDTMRDHQAELLAGDQEGYFFAHTCNFFRTNWIIVKAISDYGYKKDDSVQSSAAFTALSFVISAISAM